MLCIVYSAGSHRERAERFTGIDPVHIYTDVMQVPFNRRKLRSHADVVTQRSQLSPTVRSWTAPDDHIRSAADAEKLVNQLRFESRHPVRYYTIHDTG